MNPNRVGLSTISTLVCCVLAAEAHGAVVARVFGRVGDEEVAIYTLTNAHGIEARIMTYGATIVSLKTPDRDGHFSNVVLGFDSLNPYIAGIPYYGATVGRYANRIAKGRFAVDGIAHQLPLNDGSNSLHGGLRGFDKRMWKAYIGSGTAHNTLHMTYVSPAGEEGYPGELTVHVTYRLSEDDSLSIEYDATTTAATPVNLANHAYFNLTGNPEHPILDHVLTLYADKFTPVDSTLIPTGEVRSVADTPFDFRKPHAIGSRIDSGDEQLTLGKGYDHNWVLNADHGKLPRLAAVLTDPGSGRTMEVLTTQPGLQFYSGNFMNGEPAGHGSVFAYRTGLCLETQHFPDSPNHPSFPNTILRPGETYSEKTVLHFTVSKPVGEHR